METLLRIAAVAVGFCMMPNVAAADTFMLINGIAGDSTDTAHGSWIRVNSLSWGVNMPTGTLSSGSPTVGRATSDKLNLSIPTGIWTNKLLATLVRGTLVPQVVIDHVNPNGRTSYRLTLGNVLLTRYGNSTSASNVPMEEFDIAIGSYRAEFYFVAADGRVTTAAGGWNFTTNTAIH